jgi:transcriptional regulator with XRE-family HTH domain
MDYIEILEGLIQQDKKAGTKSRLAVYIGCQPAYVSRVLSRQADLSSDQLLKAAGFFNLSEFEKEFLMDVLQENRAGDHATKSFFRARAEKTLEKVRQLENRLRANNKLSSADEAKYYESWLYSAVHMAARIPSLQNLEALSKGLGLEASQLTQVLSELAQMGLLTFEVASQTSSLHVGESNPWVVRHHMNWRHKTAEKLSRGVRDGLHYTSVVSCSREDFALIHENFIETIQKVRKTVSKSSDEVLGHYSLDLYKLST